MDKHRWRLKLTFDSNQGKRRVLGASLTVLGLGRGPPWSQMGDTVCPDTEEIGRSSVTSLTWSAVLGAFNIFLKGLLW